ncbi:MAG TPA: prolyl oligopeptidase family serine peptidase [Ilumatobacteraceae bacterium]|nr:prolyl oligopeptidase family serine peptidase [Ilumatobacteraceae bacterium]
MAEPTVSPAPSTRRGADVEVLHGITVADPYRWLEDGDSEEVAAWVAAHNLRTGQALTTRPIWSSWQQRLAALTALPTVGVALVRGDRLFVLERAAGADQFALVLRSAVDNDEPPRVLLDPAQRAADGAVAIDWFEPSTDGALVAIGLSEGGTEQSTLSVLDVSTGSLLDDTIPNTRASTIAWLPDNSGFWYLRYPPGDVYHRHVYFHRLGTDPAGDPLVFDALPTPESWPDVLASDDGRHLLVSMSVGWSRTDAHLLDTLTGEWHEVVSGVEASSSFFFHGGELYGVTSRDATNGRLVAAPLDAPHQWRTVIPERDVVLARAASLGDELVVVSSAAAVDTIEVWSTDGTLQRTLDELGLVSVESLDTEGATAFFVVNSFDSPPQMFRMDARMNAGMSAGMSAGISRGVQQWSGVVDRSLLPAMKVAQLRYPSPDGTEIGLFVMHRLDVQPSAGSPLLLTGYGGFAIAEKPAWLVRAAAWCTAGGVFAVAGLRGGYEHGEAWHHAGRRAHKQNVFDDFHAAADWLVANGYTSRDALALEGGSNGGLLMGAAITQRPDLARVVHCAVPLLDMIRFPKFLIARLWTDEYGDPDVAEEFAWIHAYSPYHHVTDGTEYPAVLFTTAEGDSRVDPLHARKMAALLIDAGSGQDERPILLRQSGRAGHGQGKPANMRVRDDADVLTFIAWQLGAEATLGARL